jgi:hypothetical protein
LAGTFLYISIAVPCKFHFDALKDKRENSCPGKYTLRQINIFDFMELYLSRKNEVQNCKKRRAAGMTKITKRCGMES